MDNFEKTPEETREMQNTRNSVFQKLKLLAFMQLTVSAVSIVVGIITIAYSAASPSFPYIAGAPIYCPIFVIIGAVFALNAVKEGTNDITSTKYAVYL